MGEAIRNAGTLNLPPDDDGFLSFVRGPFAQAAQSVLDGTRAAELVEAIVAKLEATKTNTTTLPLGQVSGGRLETTGPAEFPISDEHTLPYGAQMFEDGRAIQPVVVVVVDPDSGFREAVVELLAARGHHVHVADGAAGVAALADGHALDVVVTNLEPGGYSFAAELRRTLGRATPRIMLLGGSLSLHAPRPGISRVIPKQLDVSLAEAVEQAATGD